MGVLSTIAGPLADQLPNRSTGAILAAGAVAFIVLTILINVLQQLLIKKLNEPPIVFHWVPFIGSTITYGIDPYKFFFSCREKVRELLFLFMDATDICRSMETFSPSFYWEIRPLSVWGPRAMSSS